MRIDVTANVLLNYLRCRRFAALNYPEIDVISQEQKSENNNKKIAAYLKQEITTLLG